MEDIAAALRTAVTNALHDPTSDEHASSDPSNISSLSGSLPSDRRKLWSHITSVESIAETLRHLMETAQCVEDAVAHVEAGLFYLCNDAEEQRDSNDGNQDGSLMDLLVTVLTSVPTTLWQRQHKLECSGDSTVEEHHFLPSMEDVCFNAASISADIILKYVMGNDGTHLLLGSLEETHVDQMMVQVLSICDAMHTHGMRVTFVLPILKIVNSLIGNRHVERTLFDSSKFVGNFENDSPHSVFHISAKDTLRLIQTLLRNVLFESMPSILEVPSSLREEMTSQVGLFTAYLLEHFAEMSLIETGHVSFKECPGLFHLWANSVNEHMTRRLNDHDAKDVPDLISQLQVENIQSALELVQRAESVIAALISDEKNQEKQGSIEGGVAAVVTSLRNVIMAVIVTEVMEKLGLESDPQVHVIFHPLIIAFARFTASGIREAAILSRQTSVGQEGDGMAHFADDLLLRMCGTTLGIDFLKHCDDVKRDDVLTIALLRALDSSCIPGKGKFLLDIAADLALTEGKGQSDCGPSAKRRCYSHIHGHTPFWMDGSHRSNVENCTPSQREMADILIMCMTMSLSCNHEDVDMTLVDQASCIASSLMKSGQNNEEHTLDPLNPWHSLNISSLKELSFKLENSHSASREELVTDDILSYSSSVPCSLDTRAANLSI
ncbi:hypothetical protein HJC23_014076 [Cyclotella cryptica]|uniref:Uncharacterized protein n=1 Tax=Cyclotella cryptica TaxID=29204 RepID=A0ABD3QTN4_9STRA|eukprot:CCRYP_002488-RA/>CCRYP_002488-RA protein AED:0.19 eAED:0.19 QI:0/-1/0/1/-1/1/1/0/664